ncbi:MAG: HAMP domain-containing protein, partial [Pseudomonadota bacterium]
MRRLTIGKQVFIGFGLVFSLFVAVAAISVSETLKLSNIFSDYRSTARQTLKLNDFVEDMFEARVAAFKYRISPSDAAHDEVVSNIAEIADDRASIDELFSQDPAKSEQLLALKAEAERYRSSFEEMSALQATREIAVARLVETGPKARKQLSFVMESAYRDGDVRAAYYAGLTQEELMLGRFYAERFLLTNADEAFDRSAAHLAQARTRLGELLAELENPERRAAAVQTQADLAAFADTMLEVRRIIEDRNAIRTGALDTIGPATQGEYENILEAVVDRQNTLGPAGLATAQESIWFVGAVAALALLLTLAVALLIARAVSGGVWAMAETMRRLAKGDLEVEIAGAEHQNELGEMARALAVFKDNALRMRALTQEKDQADADAAQARAAMMAQLQAEFGAVVEGAIAGDFSARVAADFDDQELTELARSVNRLIETVGAGVDETGRVLAHLAQGGLDERMNGAHSGAFEALQGNVNETVERLAELASNASHVLRWRDHQNEIAGGH